MKIMSASSTLLQLFPLGTGPAECGYRIPQMPSSAITTRNE